MSKFGYVVLTAIGGDWDNVWTIDDSIPVIFDNPASALDEINDLCEEMGYDREDFKVRKVHKLDYIASRLLDLCNSGDSTDDQRTDLARHFCNLYLNRKVKEFSYA